MARLSIVIQKHCKDAHARSIPISHSLNRPSGASIHIKDELAKCSSITSEIQFNPVSAYSVPNGKVVPTAARPYHVYEAYEALLLASWWASWSSSVVVPYPSSFSSAPWLVAFWAALLGASLVCASSVFLSDSSLVKALVLGLQLG